MKNTQIYTSLVSAVALAFGGCAADEHARKLAFATSQNVEAYESAVDAKVTAERAFYHSQLDTLRKRLGANSLITDPKTGKPLPIQETVAYGRIISNTERDARITAEKMLLSDTPGAMEAMIAYIETGLTADQAVFRDAMARQRDLVKRLDAGLAPVEQQSDDLAAIRKQLADLSKQPSTIDQLKEYYAFGKAVSQELKKK